MDLEQLKYLTDDQKERYVTLERTFETKGWVIVEAWAKQRAIEQLERAAYASNWEEHRVATGARLAYEQIANLREDTEKEFTMIAETNMLNAQVDEELVHE